MEVHHECEKEKFYCDNHNVGCYVDTAICGGAACIIRCRNGTMFYSVLCSNREEHRPVVQNENSPKLTVPAKIVDMRRKTHHHHSNGHHHHSHTYHVTFEVESGDRMELKVSRNEYGMLVVGDSGRVSFQGTRYLGFERGMGEPDETVI